ncbi:glutathione S-transferase T2-like [Salvia splendens]|uniref:glutathione S-transferase T2-like n=1 Tax=Salvia splendens TaxID=180675 RepID=UPI001C264AE5|nr:glutathione S-transferase T2-like [Salvia splendens]
MSAEPADRAAASAPVAVRPAAQFKSKKKPIHYTKAESVAVARAWDAATSDPVVGTDQTEFSFWKRVVQAYNEFKPRDALPRDGEQLRKKWSRILPATRRFAGIYQNNLLHAESGRSEADVKELSMEQYHTLGHPKFTMWEEFQVLQDCPKFKAICAQEQGPATKRTRHNIFGDYSSGTGSQSFDMNEEQAAEPSATHSRRARPPGQRASIRRARKAGGSSRRSSAASGSCAPQPAPLPASRAPFASEVLRDNVYAQLAHELNDACSKYEVATDPYIKNIYSDLIRQIQRRLRLADEGPGAAAAGGSEGDVEGDGEGDVDKEEESDTPPIRLWRHIVDREITSEKEKSTLAMKILQLTMEIVDNERKR